MIVSRCCKDEVYVYSAHEGTSFYVCTKCDRPCDTRMRKEDESDQSDHYFIARNLEKISNRIEDLA